MTVNVLTVIVFLCFIILNTVSPIYPHTFSLTYIQDNDLKLIKFI